MKTNKLKIKDNSVDLLKRFDRDLVIDKLHKEIETINMSVKSLEERYEKKRMMCEATFEAVFIFEKGYLIDINKRGLKMFGYDYQELIGIFVTELVEFNSKNIVKQNIDNGYESSYKVTAMRKDRSTFLAEIKGKMREYKGNQVCVTVVRSYDLKGICESEKLEEQKLQNALEIAVTYCYEMTQPLQVIYGHTELIMSKIYNPSLPEQISTIKKQAEKILLISKKIIGLTCVKK